MKNIFSFIILFNLVFSFSSAFSFGPQEGKGCKDPNDPNYDRRWDTCADCVPENYSHIKRNYKYCKGLLPSPVDSPLRKCIRKACKDLMDNWKCPSPTHDKCVAGDKDGNCDSVTRRWGPSDEFLCLDMPSKSKPGYTEISLPRHPLCLYHCEPNKDSGDDSGGPEFE